MKSILSPFATFTLGLIALGTWLTTVPAHAVNYAGNGNTSFGGDIGNGILTLTDDGTNISGKLTVGNGNHMWNSLVLFVDTGAGGGFSSTTNFNDQNDGLRKAISGVSGTSRSVLTFTNGFTPQFAIALGPNDNNFGGVWGLAAGGNGSLNYITSANLNPVGTSSGPFFFSVPGTALGLTNGVSHTIKLLGTYISNTGYRSQEAIAGNDVTAFGSGWNPFSQTAMATYTFAAPPLPTHAITFSVDMTAIVATNGFDAAGGDTVYCGGSFQTNPFAFTEFPLTPTLANSNIYSGTYLTTDPSNTTETYKFMFRHVTLTSTNDNYDFDPNRTFVTTGSSQIVPLVYFNNFPAVPSATTNLITFSIDMGPQIFLGHFNPSTDKIQVFGSFESPRWSGNFPTVGWLTNNPTLSGNASNIYSGTTADYNYPGTQNQYKFVIVSGGVNNYENGSDRTLVTPTNSGTLPLAYFSGISSYGSVPITFSVDMTVPILAGMFTNSAVVSVAGTFQTNQWTPGVLVLTNNPTSANPNIYSGTFVDQNQSGTGEFYKFQIVTATSTNWEYDPARTFLLGTSALTNPLVFWNNYNTNQVVLVPTTISFQVDMNGAVDVFSNAFNPAADVLFIFGDFTTPAWNDNPSYNNWTDPRVMDHYPAHIMQETPVGSGIYSNSFVLPAGHSIYVSYKYGIDHNDGPGLWNNTNCDNEATSGNDHHRYVRGIGSYQFPLDYFGIQRTNPAAATEQIMGNLAIGSPAAGKFPITWLGGLSGISLQTSTNLVSGSGWQDVVGTDGNSQTNWPVGNGSHFFRLKNSR